MKRIYYTRAENVERLSRYLGQFFFPKNGMRPYSRDTTYTWSSLCSSYHNRGWQMMLSISSIRCAYSLNVNIAILYAVNMARNIYGYHRPNDNQVPFHS